MTGRSYRSRNANGGGASCCIFVGRKKTAAPEGNACGSRGRRRSSTTPRTVTNWPPAKPRNVPAPHPKKTTTPQAVSAAEDSARNHVGGEREGSFDPRPIYGPIAAMH